MIQYNVYYRGIRIHQLGLFMAGAHSYQMPNSQLLIQAAEAGDAAEVARLIPLSDPQYDNSCALRTAVQYGHTKCLRLLIPVSDCNADNSIALRWAAGVGDVECVRELIPVTHSSQNGLSISFLCAAAEAGHEQCVQLLIAEDIQLNTTALWCAAVRGQANCVKTLIPVSDPKFDNSCALEAAARGGHLECVKLLLPVSDPNAALKEALINKHEECAEILYPYSNLAQTIYELNQYFYNTPDTPHQTWVNEWLACKQHEVLTAVVGEKYVSCSRKM